MSLKRFLLPWAVILVTCCGPLFADDPGILDTVRVGGGTLVVGQSKPIALTIVNDENIEGYSLGFLCSSLDGGFAFWDSVVYVNRLADPAIFGSRIARYWVYEPSPGVPPDVVVLGAGIGAGLPLPPGNTAVLLFYFTGLTTGTMTIDSTFFAPVGYFLMVGPSSDHIWPQFVSQPIQIVEGHLPPVLSVPADPIRVIEGATVNFSVAASSPEGFPVTLELIDFAGYDDSSRLPVNAPTLGAGNPAEFTWITTPTDLGIWQAVFRTCDSAGSCITATSEIQVVSSSQYLVAFNLNKTPEFTISSGLQHGDFDTDGTPELLVSGTAEYNSPPLQLWHVLSPGVWGKEYEATDFGWPKFGPQVGYVNDDSYLDALMMSYSGSGPYDVLAYLGDGGNSFTPTGMEINDGHPTRSGVSGEFTGDNHLDYASVWYDGVDVFAGDGQGGYHSACFVPLGDSGLTINTADFNDDGFDDLAVGTNKGLRIYLGSCPLGFTLAHSYSQTYASRDVVVTNQGSDFNGDNYFDLCVSTPSVGGAFSEIVVYLGAGDGSFTKRVVRTAKGQVCGNCVGDFNGDGLLDIAYVNNSLRQVGILFGSGDGYFENEIRYRITSYSPRHINCLDADQDGDLDIVVSGFKQRYDYAVFTLLNQLDPGGYSRGSLAISGHDNAEVQLVSASGKVFNQLKNTMPSGDYYERNLDANNLIDDYAAVSLVEPGEYELSAEPKPGVPVGQLFTLEFTADGELRRLAKDVPMSSSGYQFSIYAADQSQVFPTPGSFIGADPPTFVWSGSGEFDFQLAFDIDFNDLIANATVTGHSYLLPTALNVSDTATFYWRVKPHNDLQYQNRYAVNIVAGSSPTCGDADGDQAISISDVVFLVAYIFTGGPAPNPLSTADVDCSGLVDVSDAVSLVGYIFAGGPQPCANCP